MSEETKIQLAVLGECRAPRKASRLLALSCALCLVLALGCGPMGPIPGGRLSGAVGAADVDDWSFAQGVEKAQLETRPDDPHSVNCWVAHVGDRLYVPTSMILGSKVPSERSWVGHVTQDPRVRIRLGQQVFERIAVRVSDDQEYDVARTALETKYEQSPENRDPERTIWIYRLDPRAE